MQHLAASSRRSVAFGIVLALAAMTLTFLAVLAASVTTPDVAAAQQYAGAAASNDCATTNDVRTFNGSQDQTTEPFNISGDRFRIAFRTERAGGSPRLEVTVLDRQGQPTGQSFVVRGGDDGSRIIPLGPGTFRLELRANNVRYNVAVQECRAAAVAATDTTQAITAAQTTAQAANITGAEATTANTAANAADAGNDVTDADAFRCEFFLRVVRDDRGALRNQYQNDELIVQRFEQCISADVLRDTIPKRLLPHTGGLPLIGLAFLGLAAIAVGASVLRAAIRCGR